MLVSKSDSQVIFIGFLITISLFLYEVPFSLKVLSFNPGIIPYIQSLENEISKTDFYDFKTRERDFWSEVKDSDVIRLDLNSYDSEMAKTDIQNEEEFEEKVLYEFGGETLTQDEMEFLEKYRIEREEERKRLEREAKIHLPATILVVGDSTIVENLGYALEQKINSVDGLSSVKSGKYSTGLNKRDYYDWQAKTSELIEEHKPEAVVGMFGANDGQPISDYATGNLYYMGNIQWEETYRSRVREYLDVNTQSIKKFYLIGQPNSTNSDFAYKFGIINRVFAEEASKNPKVVYVNTWDKFTVNGRPAISLTNAEGRTGLVKFEDGVHLTNHGSGVVAEMVVETMEEDILRKEVSEDKN
jgi:hypothetical protein